MFVYALQISGIPQNSEAFEQLHSQLGISQHTFDQAIFNEMPLVVVSPQRTGELFFENELKSLGQTFTQLARDGLQFQVLRQRYNGDFKPVADYRPSLKQGRKAWREERLRVDAAADSLESFLCDEASAEDMEVLRPLFPNNINTLLKDTHSGVMHGSEMLLSVFPTLKGADSRRIFYAMQQLFEKRAGKWKNRVGCAWVSVYFIMVVFVSYASFEWLQTSLELHALLAAPAAFVLGVIPVIGSVLAYLSATELWAWKDSSAFFFFFWHYLPAIYPIGLLLIATLKGNGKAILQKLLGRPPKSND